MSVFPFGRIRSGGARDESREMRPARVGRLPHSCASRRRCGGSSDVATCALCNCDECTVYMAFVIDIFMFVKLYF